MDKHNCFNYHVAFQEEYANQALRLKDSGVRDVKTSASSAVTAVIPSDSAARDGLTHESDKLHWQYFDERAYVEKTKLKAGQDAYSRNKFNQAASDRLKSNREIPDSRHPLYVIYTIQ